MKTLDECKDEIARNPNYHASSFDSFYKYCDKQELHGLMKEVSKLYATSQVEEATRHSSETFKDMTERCNQYHAQIEELTSQLSERDEALKYCHGRMAEAYKEIRELTKENARLSEVEDCNKCTINNQRQEIGELKGNITDLTKEVERLKKEQEHYIQFTNEEIEKFREAYRKECVKNRDLKSENDRYREALEVVKNLGYSVQFSSSVQDIIKCNDDMFQKAKSALHPLVKEGEK
jgi:chromosome segregation ATPase